MREEEAMQMYRGKSTQCRRDSKCKGPEAGICLCWGTTRKASVDGEGKAEEGTGGNEDREPARASSGRLHKPW